jgi:hypothetical protein
LDKRAQKRWNREHRRTRGVNLQHLISKAKGVVGEHDNLEQLKDLPPWPGAHPDIRGIVTRLVTEDDNQEILRCRGYLIPGSRQLVDFDGTPLNAYLEPGDFIDTRNSLGEVEILHRAETPVQRKKEDTED